MSLLQLTWSEFLRMLRAPASLYFFLGAMGFLGFVFFVMSTFRVAIFLDLAYLFLPLFFLPLAATLITKERESGFASVLFTHPISMGQHYLSKFLALLLIVGAYLLALLPYNVLIVALAGRGWALEILGRAGWTVILASFAIALGLLISAGLGRRATLPSVSVGFAVALILVLGPFFVLQYLAAFPPGTSDTVLSLLHVSPLMGAMDTFRSHGLTLANPLSPLLLSVALAAFLLVGGLLIYVRLQSPEGWEARIPLRAGAFIGVVGVLLTVPLIPPFEYSSAEQGPQDSCAIIGTLEYCTQISYEQGPQFPGVEHEGSVRTFILNREPEPALIASLSVRWQSEYVRFNATSVRYTSVAVPPDSGEVTLETPVRITILRASSLGSRTDPVPVFVELEVDGQGFVNQESVLTDGREYDANIAWLIVGVIAAVAVGGRALGRMRRGRG